MKKEELKAKLKEVEKTDSTVLEQLKHEEEELRKQEEEFKKKEEELKKKERVCFLFQSVRFPCQAVQLDSPFKLTPWNVDTISHDKFAKTIINKEPPKPDDQNLTDEQRAERYVLS